MSPWNTFDTALSDAKQNEIECLTKPAVFLIFQDYEYFNEYQALQAKSLNLNSTFARFITWELIDRSG